MARRVEFMWTGGVSNPGGVGRKPLPGTCLIRPLKPPSSRSGASLLVAFILIGSNTSVPPHLAHLLILCYLCTQPGGAGVSDQPTNGSTSEKRKKGRSPSYPAIALDAALDRARQLWQVERQHPTPIEKIAKHWGYKSLNGPAALQLAALKKFGLLEDEGAGQSRRARVSDLAVDILANPDESVRAASIRRAALNPAIHRELWETFKTDIPSDSNLHWQLTRERSLPFTETGATEFIPEYRQTLAFAQLIDGASVTPQAGKQEQEGEDDGGDAIPVVPPPDQQRDRLRAPRKPGVKTYAIPVDAEHDAMIELPTPMTPDRWRNFKTFLTAMEGIIVDPDAGRSDTDPSDTDQDED